MAMSAYIRDLRAKEPTWPTAGRAVSSVFLTADWRWLAMLNYAFPADLLEPLVPRGPDLDLWQGDAYVSVVGFLFERIRVLGVPLVTHRRFEEVNLRFYVMPDVAGEPRHGVTFIRELVPRRLVAAGAEVDLQRAISPGRDVPPLDVESRVRPSGPRSSGGLARATRLFGLTRETHGHQL